MSDWKSEFDRRCRHLLGVIEDSVDVRVETDWGGDGCDTCGYGGEGKVEISCGSAYRSFDDVAQLINALDEVPDE